MQEIELRKSLPDLSGLGNRPDCGLPFGPKLEPISAYWASREIHDTFPVLVQVGPILYSTCIFIDIAYFAS